MKKKYKFKSQDAAAKFFQGHYARHNEDEAGEDQFLESNADKIRQPKEKTMKGWEEHKKRTAPGRKYYEGKMKVLKGKKK